MAETNEQDNLVTIPADVILQELGDEIVAANLNTGVYFALNEVAARTWVLLKDAKSVDEVVGVLVAEYEIDDATVRADVTGLLEQFEQHGLIQYNDA